MNDPLQTYILSQAQFCFLLNPLCHVARWGPLWANYEATQLVHQTQSWSSWRKEIGACNRMLASHMSKRRSTKECNKGAMGQARACIFRMPPRLLYATLRRCACAAAAATGCGLMLPAPEPGLALPGVPGQQHPSSSVIGILSSPCSA